MISKTISALALKRVKLARELHELGLLALNDGDSAAKLNEVKEEYAATRGQLDTLLREGRRELDSLINFFLSIETWAVEDEGMLWYYIKDKKIHSEKLPESVREYVEGVLQEEEQRRAEVERILETRKCAKAPPAQES